MFTQNRRHGKVSVAALALAVAASVSLAACGGGGSTAPVSPAAAIPVPNVTAAPVSRMNQLTAYTVYTGTVNGVDTVVALAPLASGAAPSNLLNAQLAPGAVVVYPDGSTQATDALANFDASQSTWSQDPTNLASIAANPGFEVEVIVDAPSVVAAQPLDTFVDVNEPGGSLVPADVARGTEATAATLAGLVVAPAKVAMYDKEERIFHAVGIGSDQKRFAVGKDARITWTITKAATCGQPAGTLRTFTADPSKAIYRAPATGTFAKGCPDLITASLATTGATFTASGQAMYYAHEQNTLVSGTLLDANKKPVANAFIDLYGTGAESANGRVVTRTNAQGKFSRRLPIGRTLTPIAANRVAVTSGYKLQYFAVSPASVNVTSAGVQNLTLTETTAIAPPNAKPR